MVWICKTHYPSGGPGDFPFSADKNLVIVRNPIDAFPSLIGLMCGLSHSLVPKQKIEEEYPDWWKVWITRCSKSLANFHDVTVNEIARKIPTYYLRYEDLRLNSNEVMKDVFKFLLDVPSIEGTIVE